MSDVIYSTDSEEHLINTGVIQEEQWCELTEFEMIEDIKAMDDYLEQRHLDDMEMY